MMRITITVKDDSSKRSSYVARILPSQDPSQKGWFTRLFLVRAVVSGYVGEIKTATYYLEVDGIYEIYDVTKSGKERRRYWRIIGGRKVADSHVLEKVVLAGIALPPLQGRSARQIDYADALRQRFFAKLVLAGYPISAPDLRVTNAGDWIAKREKIETITIDSPNDDLTRI